MQNLIGKQCLIKSDINLMLPRIINILEVDEANKWIKTDFGDKWFKVESILLIGTKEQLGMILFAHKHLESVCEANKSVEQSLKSDIMDYINQIKEFNNNV